MGMDWVLTHPWVTPGRAAALTGVPWSFLYLSHAVSPHFVQAFWMHLLHYIGFSLSVLHAGNVEEGEGCTGPRVKGSGLRLGLLLPDQ